MKPEHFIYKSDGLYYMQNVPDSVKLNLSGHNNTELEKAYFETIERAKAEALKVADNHSVILQSRIVMSLPTDQYELIEGNMYTINMEEKIDKIYQSRFRRWSDSKWSDWVDMSILEYERAREFGLETRIIARIASPKRVEESESRKGELKVQKCILDNALEALRMAANALDSRKRETAMDRQIEYSERLLKWVLSGQQGDVPGWIK